MSESADPEQTAVDERAHVVDERDQAIERLEKALGEALTRIEVAETVLEDQRKRLKSLGQGREETMRALTETRDELRRVSVERDELRKELARIDSMQTVTIALPEGDANPTPPTASLPSLEDLMAALGHTEDTRGAAAGHLHQTVHRERETEGAEEMISPLLVFPEEFATAVTPNEARDRPVTRLLVLLDAERPIKYPIHKEVMTIGRGDVADIQIENDFLSRLHARIVSSAAYVAIEDIESRNGIRVNAKNFTRQELHHGDVVELGNLRFRYIDTAAAD